MSRIIAGSARGQRIVAPRGDATRPTTDRVKESLFSALASWFDTAAAPASEQLASVSVLDLYAGSGALGLEAASRGASRVVCVESNRAAAQAIRDNARRTGLPVQVSLSKALTVARDPGTAFDLVLADPPYDVASPAVVELVTSLAASGALAADALVVVERATRTPAIDWPSAFVESWQRRYGETTLHFARFQEAP